MKPFSTLFESAAAHDLLLNWFHQDYSGRWLANWRVNQPIEVAFRASPIIDGDDAFDTLSRSLTVAIAELRPGSKDEVFW